MRNKQGYLNCTHLAALPVILYLIAYSNLFAQNAEIIQIRNLPSEGLLVSSGWKYQLGDNPEWAAPFFNDSNWDTVDPTPDIHDLPMLWRNSIVWFRLHVNIDSSLVGDLAITIAHAGASEIYFDGKLIGRFGVVSSNQNEISAYNPQREFPKALQLSQPGHHVLAVRYTLEPDVRYTTEWANSNVGLRIIVSTYKNAQQAYYDTTIYDEKNGAFRISAYMLLSFLFLAFYISNRKLKTNFLFFIYTLSWTVIWSAFLWTPAEVKYFYYFANASLILQIVGWFVYLTAIYNLFGQRKTWIFYFLIVLGLVCIPMGLFIYDWGWQVYAILFTTLADADILRVSVLSLIRGVKGAGIIVIGAAICLIMWVLFHFSYLTDSILSFNGWVYFSIHHLSIPVAVSVYLGYDLGLINKSLENKLSEIKILSSEKEYILTTQKERLEEQVTERTSELQQTIKELKATQSQLIQSEKMASLGELTAGIAHEIQNPLNFVNNFSEVNGELLTEMKDELDKGNIDDAKTIANDAIANQQKILHHGKRADAIVKGMLQHSRSSSGQKELTDINTLCDEYLRLAYHGLRAKDKSFNAKFETDFDASLPQINVMPQDIGRVILNLINNAFYAVNEKVKRETVNVSGGSSHVSPFTSHYEPLVKLSTKMLGDKIQISVADNGLGIPDSIKEKIFQPFFTTKPTGQGTGLGLSLSYDIIKAHGGDLKVNSEVGLGSDFTIELPSKT